MFARKRQMKTCSHQSNCRQCDRLMNYGTLYFTNIIHPLRLQTIESTTIEAVINHTPTKIVFHRNALRKDTLRLEQHEMDPHLNDIS